MDKRLKILCDAFLHEKKEIAEAFAETYYSTQQIDALCANMVVTRATLPDRDRLWDCRDILTADTDICSPFRGTMFIPVCCLMAASDSPQRCLARLSEVYAILHEHLEGSKYLLYSAMVLMDMPDDMLYGIAKRAARIYDTMKGVHKSLTSYEDQVLCVLFAMSGRSDEELLYESEYIFSALDMSDRDAVQSVSHILALADGLPDVKTELLQDIYNGLYELGKRYGSRSELVMLAALASVTGDYVTAVTDTADVDNYLREHEGFSGLFNGNRLRLVHAAMLTAASYTPTDKGLYGTLSMNAAEFALLYIYDQG